MSGDEVLALVSLVCALGGAGLVARGLLDRRRSASKLEGEAPDGSAAASARHEAFVIGTETSPPPWDRVASRRWAYDAEARKAFDMAKPIRAEAARRAADAIERSDQRERDLRGSLARDLRDGMWREVLGIVLLIAGAAASAIAAF